MENLGKKLAEKPSRGRSTGPILVQNDTFWMFNDVLRRHTTGVRCLDARHRCNGRLLGQAAAVGHRAQDACVHYHFPHMQKNQSHVGRRFPFEREIRPRTGPTSPVVHGQAAQPMIPPIWCFSHDSCPEKRHFWAGGLARRREQH